MAWEWVAPVATASAGIAGILATWLTGKQAREDAKQISRDTLEHQRLLAKEERQQKRLESAYVKLLEMAEQTGLWATKVFPVTDTDPPQPVPPLPSLELQAHIRALINAFGSEAVASSMMNWLTVVRIMVSITDEIGLESVDFESGPADISLRARLEKLRPEERQAREALAKKIATELGHRPFEQ
ncbi:hypothetical protein [Mycolicibacterium fortuitum]|uniref:hypothetical protein n=1 Tax=Mycolicibacterium fortuitum TaxID=1766 RepID=UPI003AAFB7FE